MITATKRTFSRSPSKEHFRNYIKFIESPYFANSYGPATFKVMSPFIRDHNLIELTGMMTETSDIPVNVYHITNGLQQDAIPVSADNFAIGSSHHVMSDETSPSDNLDSEVAASDNLENNPNIVKAEVSFHKTPHNRDCEETVFSALKKIELTCAADFTSMCAVLGDTARPAIDQISSGLRNRKIPVHAKSLSQSETAIGKDMASKRESMINRQVDQEGNALKVYKNLRGEPGLSRFELSMILGNINENSTDDKGEMDHMKRKGEGGGLRREEDHAPRPNSEHHYPLEPWSPSVGDEKNSEDEGHHHGHNDQNGLQGPPHSRGKEDHLFVGSLGYGDTGDMCMYDNFQKLAAPCQSLVANLHSLRQQHRKVGSRAHDKPGGSGFLLLGIVFVVFFVCGFLGRSCCRLMKVIGTKNDTLATLALIDADPALKAQCKPCFSACSCTDNKLIYRLIISRFVFCVHLHSEC